MRKGIYGSPWAARARALFWAWPNSARHRVWPRPGGSCRCTKVGVPQYPNLCTGSCSFPRQGLLRARRRPSCSLLNHSKTKYTRHKTETPARGACREGRTRLKTAPLAQGPGKRSLSGRLGDKASALHAPRQGPGERQAPGPGKIKAPARCLPGRLRCVPALQLIGPRVALGPIQGRVADGCAAWGTRWHSTVMDPSPWRTETLRRELLGSTATGIKCPCPPLLK